MKAAIQVLRDRAAGFRRFAERLAGDDRARIVESAEEFERAVAVLESRRAPTAPPMANAVTHEEARAILGRFIASHFRDGGREKARTTIPADPTRDDDIRLHDYITQNEALAAARGALVDSCIDQGKALAEARAALTVALAALAEQPGMGTPEGEAWIADLRKRGGIDG